MAKAPRSTKRKTTKQFDRTGLFTKIYSTANRARLKKGSIESRDWLREKSLEIQKVRKTYMTTNEAKQRKAEIRMGNMFMFFYDPKHKKTLPYYDTWPLIFVIELYSDGFLGINLHYLPILYRARLMDALYELTNNSRYNDSTKLMISYKILKSAAKLKYFKPCVKRYLSTHVKSMFVKVPSKEWDIALMLPFHRFKKQSVTKVWAESRKTIARK